MDRDLLGAVMQTPIFTVYVFCLLIYAVPRWPKVLVIPSSIGTVRSELPKDPGGCLFPVVHLDHCDAGQADTIFVASRSRTEIRVSDGVDISHRGGRPGFVLVDGDTLTPDFPGNRYLNTLGNLLSEPRGSLIFADHWWRERVGDPRGLQSLL
jgi:hypothetical protein